MHDPHADADEAMHDYGLSMCLAAVNRRHDLVVLAVPHREYLAMGVEALAALVADRGVFADLKNGLNEKPETFPTRLWHL